MTRHNSALEAALSDLKAATGCLCDFVRDGATAIFEDLTFDIWNAEANRPHWLADRIEEHVDRLGPSDSIRPCRPAGKKGAPARRVTSAGAGESEDYIPNGGQFTGTPCTSRRNPSKVAELSRRGRVQLARDGERAGGPCQGRPFCVRPGP
jgi:hypothetical protein